MIPNKGDYGDSFVKVEIDGSTPAAGSLNATNNINGWGMHVVDYFTPIERGQPQRRRYRPGFRCPAVAAGLGRQRGPSRPDGGLGQGRPHLPHRPQ